MPEFSKPLARLLPGRLHLSSRTRRALWGYFFILPWVVGFAVFSLGPILAVFGLSLTHYQVFSPPTWAGLSNYREILFEDELFWVSLYNSVYYVGIGVPLQLALAFVAALLLNTKIRGVSIYRTVYYLPMVVPPVAHSLLFMWLLHPQLGVLKQMLGWVGLPSPLWLQSEVWSKPAMIVLHLWHIGGSMLIFLAGLQGISEHLYEAARIDGADGWRELTKITMPLMTPSILFNLVTGIISSFQVFASAFIMTKGGPLNSTLFYVLYLYRNAFTFFKMGYASALAVILFILVLACSLFVFRTSGRWVHYEVR